MSEFVSINKVQKGFIRKRTGFNIHKTILSKEYNQILKYLFENNYSSRLKLYNHLYSIGKPTKEHIKKVFDEAIKYGKSSVEQVYQSNSWLFDSDLEVYLIIKPIKSILAKVICLHYNGMHKFGGVVYKVKEFNNNIDNYCTAMLMKEYLESYSIKGVNIVSTRKEDDDVCK